MKEFFGYGRTRSGCDKGDIVKRHFNDYVNCIHTMVGGGWKTMEVLVAEFDMSEIKYIGQMSSSQNSRVIDPEGISYAVTNGHKDGEPKIIEPIGYAMRGRNPENPSERGRSNGKYKQRIEMGRNISNTITSVQKDSLVAEPICLNSKVNGKQPSLENRIYDVNGTSTCITTCFHPNIAEPLRIPQATKQGYIEFKGHQLKEGDGFYLGDSEKFFRGGLDGMSRSLKVAQTDVGVVQNYRIRKLTPRECFRLMGVSESDIDKIQQSGVSTSQQYKMAGNSIVVDVLEHIFRKMFVNTGQESQQLSLF